MSDAALLWTLAAAVWRGAPSQAATEAFAPVGADRWWRLFHLAQRARVAALLSQAFGPSLRPPQEVLLPWMIERQKAEEWSRYQAAVQRELTGLFEAEGIGCHVLKGTSLAACWPWPQLREYGDVDLFFPSRHDEADALARRKLGVQDLHDDRLHHTKYTYRGVTVESHYRLFNPHYPRSNRAYEALLRECDPASARFKALYMLRHMAIHFASDGLTLRDMMDWKFFWRSVGGQLEELAAAVAAQACAFGMQPLLGAWQLVDEACGGAAVQMPLPEGDREAARRMAALMACGSGDTHEADGAGRVLWKVRRWRKGRWRRKLALPEADATLLWQNATSHLRNPRSVAHKQ